MSRTVHVVGFDNDRPTSITLCPEGETPHEAYERIRSNALHFGHEVSDVRYTYQLGGRPIDASEVAFTVGPDMWHVVAEAKPDEWTRKPDVAPVCGVCGDPVTSTTEEWVPEVRRLCEPDPGFEGVRRRYEPCGHVKEVE